MPLASLNPKPPIFPVLSSAQKHLGFPQSLTKHLVLVLDCRVARDWLSGVPILLLDLSSQIQLNKTDRIR